MDYISYEEGNDDFFGGEVQEIQNLNFNLDVEEEQADRDSFLPDPKPIQPIFTDFNAFERLLSTTESQKTLQTGDSEFSEFSYSTHKVCNLIEPIGSRSHKISKQDGHKTRGKGKIAKITEESVLLGAVPSKYIPEEFNQPDIDQKTRQKMLQAIRNRVAAQNSRDKKKQLLSQLDEQNNLLVEENTQLKAYVMRLEEINSSLVKENQQLKKTVENCQLNHSQFSTEPKNEFIDDFGGVLAQSLSSNENELLASTESSNISGPLSPVMRRSHRSGGFMTFSFAMIALMAVIMYGGNQPLHSTALSIVSDRSGFKTNPSQLYFSKGRILQDADCEGPGNETELISGHKYDRVGKNQSSRQHIGNEINKIKIIEGDDTTHGRRASSNQNTCDAAKTSSTDTCPNDAQPESKNESIKPPKEDKEASYPDRKHS